MTAGLTAGWRERRIVCAGIGIAVFERGSTADGARALVLVHGLGHWTQAAWDAFAPLLDPALRVVAFDLPGFGASDKPDAAYDGPFFAHVLDCVLAETAPGKIVLCGHSVGGYIAANYAAAHPERLERLILIAPAGFLRAAALLYMLIGSPVARWIFTRRPGRNFVNRTLDQSVHDPSLIGPAIRETAYALALQPEVRRAFAGIYTGAIQEFRDGAALHRRLATWTGPTLLIWGRHDRFIPIKALETARGVYPAAAVLVCEHSGHLPMVEEAPLVADAVNAFVGQTQTRPA
jgi:pimeloyl-ACP methyl ester carboxylesterase